MCLVFSLYYLTNVSTVQSQSQSQSQSVKVKKSKSKSFPTFFIDQANSPWSVTFVTSTHLSFSPLTLTMSTFIQNNHHHHLFDSPLVTMRRTNPKTILHYRAKCIFKFLESFNLSIVQSFKNIIVCI